MENHSYLLHNFRKNFLKIPGSREIFQNIQKIGENILLFSQQFCENNRSKLNSMKKAKRGVREKVGGQWGDGGGAVGVFWGCGGGGKIED